MTARILVAEDERAIQLAIRGLLRRDGYEVELADTLIRIFDYAGGFGYDLQGAYREKMAYNALAPNSPEQQLADAFGSQLLPSTPSL